jgi:hypothetical protein
LLVPCASRHALCILPKDSAAAFCQELQEMDGWAAHIIGDVVEGSGVARIT